MSSPCGSAATTLSNWLSASADSRSSSCPKISRFSRTVPGISTGRCGSHPIIDHQVSRSIRSSVIPSSRTRPVAGTARPVIACSAVDFPAPL
ncbi:Uncharacterised protein [Mycobacteroides abscessus subsp. abscessus]|nr:Uncharacterised protein [Mycobacteroides abscessus subsp. abscessus]